MIGRAGTTITSKLTLKNGSNAVVAVMPIADAPASVPERLNMVAQALADAFTDGQIPSKVELVGDESTGMTNAKVYLIGFARPVYIAPIGPSTQLTTWNEKMGAPAGIAVYFFSVNIDWRYLDSDFTVPAGVVVFPNGGVPVTGAPNWPDGDLVFQQQRLQEERADKRAAAVATWIQSANQTAQFVVKDVGEGAANLIAPTAKALTPLLLGGLGIYLLYLFGLKKNG